VAQTYPDKFPIEEADQGRFTDAVVATKSDIWSHEGEWRAVKVPRSDTGYHSIKPYVLRQIVFGCRADDKLRDFVRVVLNDTVEITETKMKPSEYSLVYGE
jgi:hypothetical protein